MLIFLMLNVIKLIEITCRIEQNMVTPLKLRVRNHKTVLNTSLRKLLK
jgi:hypothetical protein